MPGGIKAVKIIYQVLAWLYLIGCVLGGIGMMIAATTIGATAEEGTVAACTTAGMGVFFIIMGVVVFILYFITAKGVANKRNWGKILAIIFGILMLLSIPIGTVLGIIILINIFGEQGKAWFAGTAAETTTPT